MLGEDLSIFFNPAEHAAAATIKTAAGAQVRTANVILTEPVQELSLGSREAVALQPFLQCQTGDLAGVKAGHIFEAGAKSFAVVRWEHDGTGVSVVYLRKQ